MGSPMGITIDGFVESEMAIGQKCKLRKQPSWEIQVIGEFLKGYMASPAPSPLLPGFYEVF